VWGSLRCLLLLGALAASLWAADRAAEFQRAQALEKAGNRAEALAIYRGLAQADPANAALLTHTALAEFNAGNFPEAARWAADAVRLQPDSVGANLFLGASLLKLGRAPEALDPLSRVISLRPGERNALLLLAEAHLGTGEFQEALPYFESAAALMPENPRAWHGLARACDHLSREAAADLTGRHPASPFASAWQAQAYLDAKDYNHAFTLYRKSLEPGVNIPGVHAALAAIYRATGHPDWAAIEAARERSAIERACRPGGAACHFAQSRHKEAAWEARNAEDPAALYWRARAYAKLAEDAAGQLTSLPRSLEQLAWRAYVAFSAGRYVESARLWQEALDMAGSLEARRGLALALHGARDYEGALVQIEALRAAGQKDPELLFLAGSSLLNQQKVEDAIPPLEQAVNLDPGFLAGRAALGQALLQTGRAQEASGHLRAALPLDSDGTQHYQLARAQQAAGHAEAARQTLLEYQRLATEARKRHASHSAGIDPP
jgi:predicted Zn-dependent protease